jgi:hypothetical protein
MTLQPENVCNLFREVAGIFYQSTVDMKQGAKDRMNCESFVAVCTTNRMHGWNYTRLLSRA